VAPLPQFRVEPAAEPPLDAEPIPAVEAEAGRVQCLLGIHAVIDNVRQHLRMSLSLIQPAHDAEADG